MRYFKLNSMIVFNQRFHPDRSGQVITFKINYKHMKSSKLFLTLFILLSTISVFGQKPESVLFTIGNEAVTLGDFEYIYNKNNKTDKNYYKDSSVREYLNLFINFKLKVKEAKSMGVDTAKAFVTEFSSYRDQLTKPYLTDKNTSEKLMQEAYERMKWELRASHILIRLAEDALPADTLKAYKKIEEAYNRAAKGEDFEKLAVEYSEDPSVKSNKGDLGYFSVFHLIYSFENVAYNTNNGQISKPFRTQFGYHILKISDRRPYQGQMKVADIFIKNAILDTTSRADIAHMKIDSVYNKLLKGASFNEMVKMYSEDNRSKARNGELPEFNSFSYQIPEKVRTEAFQLQKNGDLSKPFKTDEGWYIIQRIDLKGLTTYKEMENFIKNKVSRDSRSMLSQQNAIEKIKAENNFKDKPKNLSIFNKELDSSALNGKWKISNPDKFNKPLFQLGKETFSQLDFAKFIEERQSVQHYSNIPYMVKKLYEDFVNTKVLDYADRHLEEKYPDFKFLVNEYKEGMMLFDITDKLVWSKAMNDTIGLELFYKANLDKYMWKDRVEAEIYTCKDKQVATDVMSMLKLNKQAEEIATTLNKKNPMNISFSKGLYERGENEYLNDNFNQTGTFLANKKPDEEAYRVLNITKKIPAEAKKLEDIKGIAISDYQNYLEKKWITDLKTKYPVTVNEDILKTIIKN
jgi:peptidyl-prolyl cis-trans isomerase SurA